MSDDLVKRLRELGDHASFEPHMHHTAANRIEELEAEAKIQEVILESIIEGRDATFALMLNRAETAETKLDLATDFILRLNRFATQADDKFLIEKSQEVLAELTGGKDE